MKGTLVLGGIFAVVNLLTFLSIGVRETLVYFDPVPALALYLLGFVVGMALIPWLAQRGASMERSIAWPAAIATVMVLLELTWLFNIFIGAFCRGPNWNFYWPWEERDAFRVEMLNHVDLSQIYWFRLGFASRPEAWPLRESPGFILLALWLIAVPLTATWGLRRQWPQFLPDRWRLAVACFLVQFMSLLPQKMLLRTAMNLKYIVSLPEFGLNV